MSVVLVDSGGANIGSLRYALQRLGVEAPLVADAASIRAADHVILPGVGAAAAAMARLRRLRLVNVLRGLRQPVLGVCLGMQLLCSHSEEGDVDCLAIVDAPVRRLVAAPGARVPHTGWNRVVPQRPSRLAPNLSEGWAYFVHSYAVPLCGATLATADHAGKFSAMIGKANFLGAQFHPERSSAFGAELLRGFLSA